MLGFHDSFFFFLFLREARFFIYCFIWHWLGLVGEREFDRLSSSICKTTQ